MINKFNVVLLHIGICDERNENYPSLYSKCYESVKKEFKNDNIIIFHSFEEVFEKFPKIETIIKTRFNIFWDKAIDFRFKTDLIRFLLTMFYENMVYIDADIYVFEGCRDNLINQIQASDKNIFLFLFLFGYQISCIFYCKKYFSKLNLFLETFTEHYDGDKSLIVLKDNIRVKCIYFKVTHYGCLGVLQKGMNNSTKVFIVDEAYNDYAENENFWRKLNNVFILFLKDETGCYYLNHGCYCYDINTMIMIDDLLEVVGYKNLPKVKENINQVFNSLNLNNNY